jgi:hypothetical protein
MILKTSPSFERAELSQFNSKFNKNLFCLLPASLATLRTIACVDRMPVEPAESFAENGTFTFKAKVKLFYNSILPCVVPISLLRYAQ